MDEVNEFIPFHFLFRCWFGNSLAVDESGDGDGEEEDLDTIIDKITNPNLLEDNKDRQNMKTKSLTISEMKLLLKNKRLLMRGSERGARLNKPGGLLFFWGNDVVMSAELLYFIHAKCDKVVGLCKNTRLVELVHTSPYSCFSSFDYGGGGGGGGGGIKNTIDQLECCEYGVAYIHPMKKERITSEKTQKYTITQNQKQILLECSQILGQNPRGDQDTKVYCWYEYASKARVQNHQNSELSWTRTNNCIDFIQVSKHDTPESLIPIVFWDVGDQQTTGSSSESSTRALMYRLDCTTLQLVFVVSSVSVVVLSSQYADEIHPAPPPPPPPTNPSSFEELLSSYTNQYTTCHLRKHSTNCCCSLDVGYTLKMAHRWNLPFGFLGVTSFQNSNDNHHHHHHHHHHHPSPPHSRKDTCVCTKMYILSELVHMCATFFLFSKSSECTVEHFYNLMATPGRPIPNEMKEKDPMNNINNKRGNRRLVPDSEEACYIGHAWSVSEGGITEKHWENMVNNHSSTQQKSKGISGSGCLLKRLLIDPEYNRKERTHPGAPELDPLYRYAVENSVLHHNPALVWDILLLIQRLYGDCDSSYVPPPTSPSWFFNILIKWLCTCNSIYEYNTTGDIDILVHKNFDKALLRIPCSRFTTTTATTNSFSLNYDFVYLLATVNDRGRVIYQPPTTNDSLYTGDNNNYVRDEFQRQVNYYKIPNPRTVDFGGETSLLDEPLLPLIGGRMLAFLDVVDRTIQIPNWLSSLLLCITSIAKGTEEPGCSIPTRPWYCAFFHTMGWLFEYLYTSVECPDLTFTRLLHGVLVRITDYQQAHPIIIMNCLRYYLWSTCGFRAETSYWPNIPKYFIGFLMRRYILTKNDTKTNRMLLCLHLRPRLTTTNHISQIPRTKASKYIVLLVDFDYHEIKQGAQVRRGSMYPDYIKIMKVYDSTKTQRAEQNSHLYKPIYLDKLEEVYLPNTQMALELEL